MILILFWLYFIQRINAIVKMYRIVVLFICISSLMGIVSCDRASCLLDGKYSIASISFSGVLEESECAKIYENLPVLSVEGRHKIRVIGDFPFDYFKDDVYYYSLVDGFLMLEGRNSNVKIRFERFNMDGSKFYLYLENEYVNSVLFMRENI